MNTATINVQAEVMRLLDWDELQYSEFKYDMGIAYLNAYINDCDEVINYIIRSQEFWNWWKKKWHQRDMEWLSKFQIPLSRKNEYHEMYRVLHDPNDLAAEIYPHGKALGESYAIMIDALNKEVLHHE